MIGTTVGSYEILSKLGEGGMGQVYRAHDRKLGRDVALKILPEAFASDADRLARFEREARTLASLNHPNIAHVYDTGRTDSGVVFLAMELVPGDDLAARLRSGPLPLDQAVAIGKQIATALEAAHEQAIVHRDLKPANIKVRDDGTVKVLDFGLAKSAVGDSAATMTSPAMTAAGIILGTAAYMSPEQAKGRVVDKRADIWAFGVVLREMLTGQSLFAGESVAETLGKVLHEPITEQHLPATTPGVVRQLIARCLDRDPATRLRDIGEARIALTRVGDAATDTPPSAASAASLKRVPLPAIAAGIVLIALAGLAGWMLKPAPSSTASPRKLDIITKNLVANLNPNTAPVLSPDGTRLLYFADGRLRVRSMDKLEADALPDTDGAGYYAWSPDSRRVAYVAKDQIWVQDLAGTAPTAIGPAPAGLAGAGGLAWNDGNEIAVGGSSSAGIVVYSTRGGEPRTLVALDKKKDSDFHEISALPGGRGWLVAVHRSQGSDTIAAVVNGVRKDVLTMAGETLRSPVYVAPGHLLFQRARNNIGLVAVPFSLDRLETTGEPFMVVPGAWQPSVTADGTELAFVRKPDVVKHFVWVSRTGAVESVAKDALPIAADDTDQSFSLSPDGHTVAFSSFESGPSDLWTYDLERGTKARLTGQGGVGAGVYAPIWTGTGRRVLFAAFLGQVYWNIYGRAADLSGEIETVVNDGDFVLPFHVSSDDQWLLYGRGTTGANAKLMVRRLDGSDTPRVLVATGLAPMGRAALSPDGHWFAYTANESGTDEIIVRRFPSGEGRWPISSGGGTFPVWSNDGRELIYRSRDRIMSAPIKATATTFDAGASTPLFPANADNGLASSFQPSRDGKRLLMVRSTGEDRITVILNFPSELQRAQQSK